MTSDPPPSSISPVTAADPAALISADPAALTSADAPAAAPVALTSAASGASPAAVSPAAASPAALTSADAQAAAASAATRMHRPTPQEISAAADRTIPDLVGEHLRVLFSGINPSLYSAATGHHFARPGNRFWPALHASGFTPRLLHPSEQFMLPALGLGITNVVARASARADELTPAELVRGGEILAALAERWQPRFLAILGVTAYRTAFARPKAKMGPQDHVIGGVQVWVLPNPSGLNAHYTAATLATTFAELREAADGEM